jgi:hypothetical protein
MRYIEYTSYTNIKNIVQVSLVFFIVEFLLTQDLSDDFTRESHVMPAKLRVEFFWV